MTWQNVSPVRGPDERESHRSVQPQLSMLFGPGSGERAPFCVRDPSVVLGRGASGAALCFLDPKVSRNHAELRLVPASKEVELIDLSANGTWIDGGRVTRAVLRDGSVIRIGDTFLLFRYAPLQIRNATIEDLIGQSPAIMELRHVITQLRNQGATTLIVGEGGTGKEFVARCLHRESRRPGAFVAVNCAAVPEAVAESLLFGDPPNSLVEGQNPHPGYVRAAEKGTLFLDEIGELPLTLQSKLLHVLETGTTYLRGSSVASPCHVHFVFATSRDLESDLKAGRIRSDLYSRVAQTVLRIPPLRARREDILPLLRTALGEQANTLSTEIVEALLLDPWTYNVRELFAVARRMKFLGLRDGASDLALFRTSRGMSPTAALQEGMNAAMQNTIKELPPTRERVLEVVTRLSGNIRRTAEELGRSRKQVYRYLELYGVDLEALRSRPH
jgi:DNA-binding NtrC family response regulator